MRDLLDAELFEGVDGKVLETGNVEDADVRHGRTERNRLVHETDDLIEEPNVDGLGKRIARILRLVNFQWHAEEKALVLLCLQRTGHLRNDRAFAAAACFRHQNSGYQCIA